MVSLTNQEWILIFAVLVAFVVFVAAVIIIVYTLIRALDLEEERIEAQAVHSVKKDSSICHQHLSKQVVLNMEGKPIQTSFKYVAEEVQFSPTLSSLTVNLSPHKSPNDNTSTLDVEFENQAEDYHRKLLEIEGLVKTQKLAQEKQDREVLQEHELEVLDVKTPDSEFAVSPSDEVFTPPQQVITSPKQLNFKKLDRQLPSLKSFTQPQQLKTLDRQLPTLKSFCSPKQLKSSKKFVRQLPPLKSFTPPQELDHVKKLNSSLLPPMKSFTPPRPLTPRDFSFSSKRLEHSQPSRSLEPFAFSAISQNSAPDQPSKLSKKQRSTISASRRTFKRGYSSIKKKSVRPFSFE